ncbi:MAG: ArsB/NhaD family transporter [Marinilabiliaceae bacterium]|nr:ArsB/NhaD family transporter [Marinilabiliaceae bacterium]
MSDFQVGVVLVVFVVTFAAISLEKVNNAIAAMVGAFIILSFRVVSQEEALHYVDFDTIGLLFGMMLIVTVMRKTGLFEYIAIRGIKLTNGNPWRILVILSLITAVLSAFLDNVTTVLIIVPLTYAVTDSLNIDPIPILISEILFSNIGGAATLIGDPPNIMIGGSSHLEFIDFINNNLPIVVVIGAVTLLILRFIYYKKMIAGNLEPADIMSFDEHRAIQDKSFFVETLTVFLIVIAGFVAHPLHQVSLATIAIGGGFVLMLVTRQDTEETLSRIEWPPLFFFMGLFVIVGGLEKIGVIKYLAKNIIVLTDGDIDLTAQFILWLSALSTTVINSIPYTATLISVIHDMVPQLEGNTEVLWWALSLGACLGGNGTIVGAAANIIAAGFSQKTAYPLTFMKYLKIALPLMLVSIVLVSVYFLIRY